MFFQSYNAPVMSGGLFGRGSDAMMVNDPSTNPIMSNRAFNEALKLAYQGYKMDRNNPSMNRNAFFTQYGNLGSPGQSPNQLDGALFGFAKNNFNPNLFGSTKLQQNNFGFKKNKYGQINDIDQYMAAANTRWR